MMAWLFLIAAEDVSPYSLRSSQRVYLLRNAEVLVVRCLSSPADPPEAQNRTDTPARYLATVHCASGVPIRH
jgi:hypothetical protein